MFISVFSHGAGMVISGGKMKISRNRWKINQSKQREKKIKIPRNVKKMTISGQEWLLFFHHFFFNFQIFLVE